MQVELGIYVITQTFNHFSSSTVKVIIDICIALNRFVPMFLATYSYLLLKYFTILRLNTVGDDNIGSI